MRTATSLRLRIPGRIREAALFLACTLLACEVTQESIRNAYATVRVSDPTDWIPGDEGLVQNTRWGGSGGLDYGQNLIYMGGQSWWGHYFSGPKTQHLSQWTQEVHSWNGGAALLPGRNVPTQYLQGFGTMNAIGGNMSGP